jgi:hypothetical protein
MSTPNTNYRENVFRHQDLTRIHGEPDFSSLKVITREIKANAKSVHSTLGGAVHGHLGLVVSPAQYALISPTPFERVPFPEPLDLPAGTTQVAAALLTRNHTEQIRLFREVLGVENALKQQLIKAVEPNYLDALRDPVTYDLQGTIYENLTFLTQTYGKVTSQQLEEKFDLVNATVYNPTLPIDTLFNQVIELSDVAEAAAIPYTVQQQMTLVYNILNRSGRMVQDIKEWNRTTPALKTWDNFKIHFRRAHMELRETSSDTIQALQQANIAQQVIEGIAHLIPNATETPTEETTETPAEAPADTSGNQGTDSASLPDFSALSVTDSATIIPSLIQQIGTMQTMMMNMQNSMCGQTNGRGHGLSRRGRGRGRGGNQGGRGGYVRNPANHTHYCWTHGMCRHNGTQCETRAEGHKPEATETNRMGGSTRNLAPAA